MAGRGSLRKIIKIVATRCHISKLKCTKFDFSAPHANPLAGFKGPISKKKGRKKEKREGRDRGKVHEDRQPAIFGFKVLHCNFTVLVN